MQSSGGPSSAWLLRATQQGLGLRGQPEGAARLFRLLLDLVAASKLWRHNLFALSVPGLAPHDDSADGCLGSAAWKVEVLLLRLPQELLPADGTGGMKEQREPAA